MDTTGRSQAVLAISNKGFKLVCNVCGSSSVVYKVNYHDDSSLFYCLKCCNTLKGSYDDLNIRTLPGVPESRA